MQKVQIAGKSVGENAPCFIIAEMGLSHDGSLGAAHSFIDAAARAGADAVKFQTHIAEAEGTAEEKFRTGVFSQDLTRQDYWRRTAFTKEQWKALKKHSDDNDIVFLSSPFSARAADLLVDIGVSAWKVASGETNNLPLIQKLLGTGLPMLVSTGMSRTEEIDRTTGLIKDAGLPLVLFQCTNRYPCPPEHLGLNLIADYREKYEVPVGFSDHSGKVASGLAAFTLGACALEVHATFSRESFGPDVSSSLTFPEVADLVDGVRFLERAKASPVCKDDEAEALSEIRSLFTKSVVAADDLPAGTVLRLEHFDYKKPGTGIPAADADKIAGKGLRTDKAKDSQILAKDLS